MRTVATWRHRGQAPSKIEAKILTVTLNPSVDEAVFVEELRLHDTNRVLRVEDVAPLVLIGAGSSPPCSAPRCSCGPFASISRRPPETCKRGYRFIIDSSTCRASSGKSTGTNIDAG